MPNSNAQRGKEFHERRKKRKTSRKSSKKVTKPPQKNNANSSSATAKPRSEYMRKYQARKKTLQNTLLMPSLMTNRKIGQIHQVLLPNPHQSTHERISTMEKNIAKYTLNAEFKGWECY
ncbi:hypothetical protein TNCV_2371121 [Trichonephila clavipes]|nr:hypothetical protein TNCV_2371121 [Trichonephila clavipes]